MKRLFILLLFCTLALNVSASEEAEEEPVQHLKIADVTSMEEAKRIFNAKTSEMKSRERLDPLEIQEIHIITYSLEKGVAYFAENLEGESQELAKEIAVVVEDIHIASERNRQEDVERHLQRYFDLAEELASAL